MRWLPQYRVISEFEVCIDSVKRATEEEFAHAINLAHSATNDLAARADAERFLRNFSDGIDLLVSNPRPAANKSQGESKP